MKYTMSSTGSTLLMTGTIILYFINRFALADWAGISAICAGISTILVNLFRIIYYIKEKLKK